MLRFSLALTKGPFCLRAEAPEPCQRLALMGPSGVGKSTLLSALAGFEGQARGTLHLGDRLLAREKKGLAPEARRLGMVFQRPLLFPHLTAQENLRFARPLAPPPVSYEEIVTRLDLAPVLRRRAHQLSGGEAQRVALGRALLAAPAWLLLDEPFANLDPARREAALSLIDEAVERQGLALVLATHRLEEAVSLCDYLLPLIEENGVSTGTAQPLALALGGSGAPTLVSGTLQEDKGTRSFHYAGQPLTVKAAPFLSGSKSPGTAAALIEPQDVRVLPAGAPAPLGCPRFEGQRLDADRLRHGEDVFTLPLPPGPEGAPVAFTILGATVLPPRRRAASPGSV